MHALMSVPVGCAAVRLHCPHAQRCRTVQEAESNEEGLGLTWKFQ